MLKDFLSKERSASFYLILCVCCVSVLSIISLLTIYSVTSFGYIAAEQSAFKGVGQQVLFVGIGILVCAIMYRASGSVAFLLRFRYFVLGLVFLGILVAAFFGVTVDGASRWIQVGPFTIQPGEFLKIGVILIAADLGSRFNDGEIGYRELGLWAFLLILIPIGTLLVFCNDMGTSLICVAAVLVIFWISGVDKRLITGVFLLGLIGIAFMIFAGGSFRSKRFLFINPWDDGKGGVGSGYQIIRSYYAIASGGLFGRGLGSSHEKYDYLTQSDTDFIFSIICEEMGLLGALVVIICVVLIFWCGYKFSQAQDVPVMQLVVFGAAFALFFQSLVNIGSAVGALPTTGKPLPFVSAGGSSALASFILLGFVLASSRSAQFATSAERRRGSINVYTRNSPARPKSSNADSDYAFSSRGSSSRRSSGRNDRYAGTSLDSRYSSLGATEGGTKSRRNMGRSSVSDNLADGFSSSGSGSKSRTRRGNSFGVSSSKSSVKSKTFAREQERSVRINVSDINDDSVKGFSVRDSKSSSGKRRSNKSKGYAGDIKPPSFLDKR
ncbi:MAG: FtsW/RodA/SpoVE family cell cycle protein [Phoenicibacter congonensis]|uniref:Probable peptidoglycan glycosyltransferase FtsW n=1 Tax=Phoenicibacter congonensis TaxID=1944646 RepID=A0AA43RJT9_9ACTN|nr:FtsW/RodA/SpoVE family cell cycle protein [Phoenicibacter congonensis]